MKKILSLLVISSLALACNNQAAADESSDETHSEEGHSHEAEATNENMEVPPVPANAKVFFANLEDGAEITSPVYVSFGIEGMEVEPAGDANEGKGHHHIIIDGGALPSGKIVPADERNIHYGDGSSSDTLTLTPGKHRLTLQFADGYHRSYGPQMSETITVMVK